MLYYVPIILLYVLIIMQVIIYRFYSVSNATVFTTFMYEIFKYSLYTKRCDTEGSMYTQHLCLLVVMVTKLYQLDAIYIKVIANLFTTLSNKSTI